jgi:hypothetical protein
MKRLFLCLLTIGILILSGCAQPPTLELNGAQKAIDNAHAAEADKYAVEEFGAAQKALTEARTEITNQDKNFVLTRNYTAAKNLLKDAETKAQAAQAAAKDNKEKVKSEVEGLIRETTASLEAAKADLDKAPKTKNTKAELDALKANLDTLATKIDQAKTLVSSGDYLQAKASLILAKKRPTEIATERQHTAEKIPAKGKTKVS